MVRLNEVFLDNADLNSALSRMLHCRLFGEYLYSPVRAMMKLYRLKFVPYLGMMHFVFDGGLQESAGKVCH
jgi:hypothetical protein